ncbi:ImmA/IrrE family metallo-endopeptidase [Arthrobacter psychrolactophilus]
MQVASQIRQQLRFELNNRQQDDSRSVVLRRLIDAAEDAGILVMASRIVGNNTHRSLNTDEFRGFTLSDPYAPLVFINGADSMSAQLFTLIHEICHLWLGQSALTDSSLMSANTNESELWCDRVAAEVLVPRTSLISSYQGAPTVEAIEKLARQFKVSTIVIMKCLFDAGLLPREEFDHIFQEELTRIQKIREARTSTSDRENYITQPFRVSRKFARAIIAEANTGRTLHGEAYRLLGTRTHEAFTKLGERVGAA